MTSVAPEPRLSDFFLRIADDPSLLETYQRDPEATLANARIGGAQIDAVLAGPEAVRSALDTELVHDPALRRFITEPRMSVEGPDDDDSDDDEPDDDEPDGDE